MTENRKTAVYIRLSMEDENVDGRTKLESDSVTSQRILLKSFVIDQLGMDEADILEYVDCLLYTSPSPRDRTRSRMPSSA